MKNVLRRLAPAVAALVVAAPLAAPAVAQLSVGVTVPLPPPPPEPARFWRPPLPPVPEVVIHARRPHRGYVWVEGRWVVPPYREAVWVRGHHDAWGRWVPGHWRRCW